MEESWQDLLCRVYQAGYEDRQRERDYDPMGNEVVDAARIRAETMERRIHELESINADILAAGDQFLSDEGYSDEEVGGLLCPWISKVEEPPR